MYKRWHWGNVYNITILDEVAPPTVGRGPEVDIPGAGVVVAANVQEVALGKCVQ